MCWSQSSNTRWPERTASASPPPPEHAAERGPHPRRPGYGPRVLKPSDGRPRTGGRLPFAALLLPAQAPLHRLAPVVVLAFTDLRLHARLPFHIALPVRLE